MMTLEEFETWLELAALGQSKITQTDARKMLAFFDAHLKSRDAPDMNLIDRLDYCISEKYTSFTLTADEQREVLDALKSPPGYVLVPVEPTREMKLAGGEYDAGDSYYIRNLIEEDGAGEVWRLMITAAQEKAK